MSPDRWRRIEAIFDTARARPRADRDAYVAEAAAGDESLRREIMSLLQQPSSSAFIDGTISRAIPAEPIEDGSLVGQRVGVYEVTEILGAGGMGRVYRARDARLGRDVALKVLSRAFADTDSVPRLEREARTLASLNHPHIGAIYGLEEIDGSPALVLELIDGPTLASRLASGPLPLDDVRRYGAQIADALAEAHAAGIVHRDLKPSNVMLTRNGAKVVDFGMAKASTSHDGTITKPGVVAGTPAYVAPEQFDSTNVEPTSDLFALGLVLYEMATGQLPMPGASLGAVMRKGAVAIPAASKLSSVIPPALDALIVRLLEKEPTRRPISAAVVRDQLRMDTLPSSRRRHLAAAIAGLVLVIAMTIWWTIGGRNSFLRPTSVSAIVQLPGDKRDPALSPDGSTLAFSWGGANGDRSGIYTVDVKGGDAQQLTHGPSSDVSPVWAPDGRHVAFVRLHPGGASELMVVPASGGSERKLSDVRMPEILRRSLRPLLGWTGDGRGIIVPIEDAETDRVSFFKVGLDGRERVRLIGASGGLGPTQPTVSRNSRWMAYVSRDPRRLGVQAIDADDAPRGEFEYAGDRLGGQSPSLSPDGTELLFVSGTEILQWNARTKTVHVVYVSAHPIQAMTVAWPAVGSPRVVFSSEPNQAEMRATTVRDGGHSLADARGAFVHAGSAPSFSPDGRWLAFDGGTAPLSVAAIWLADSEGKRARPLTVPGFSRASWSHDGRRLAFHGGARSQIYVLDVDPEREIARPQGTLTATPPRQLTDVAFGVLSPDWSADDRYLYVTRPGTNYRVMRVPVSGGAPEDLFEGGFKRLDPSRRRIYYGKSDQFGIFVRSLDGDVRSNPEERLVSDYVPPRGFDVSGRGVFYVGRDANRNPVAMRFFDFATRRSSDLAPAPRGVIPTITVSPDGERLLFDTVANPASSLTLMQLSRSAG